MLQEIESLISRAKIKIEDEKAKYLQPQTCIACICNKEIV